MSPVPRILPLLPEPLLQPALRAVINALRLWWALAPALSDRQIEGIKHTRLQRAHRLLGFQDSSSRAKIWFRSNRHLETECNRPGIKVTFLISKALAAKGSGIDGKSNRTAFPWHEEVLHNVCCGYCRGYGSFE